MTDSSEPIRNEVFLTEEIDWKEYYRDKEKAKCVCSFIGFAALFIMYKTNLIWVQWIAGVLVYLFLGSWIMITLITAVFEYEIRKKEEIENVLGVKLKNPTLDFEAFKCKWLAFYIMPMRYKESDVIPLIREWYNETRATKE